MKDNHFLERCRERGLAHIAADVYWDLRLALARVSDGTDADGEYIEKVMALPTGRNVYRFAVADGVFYAVVAEAKSPITLLTHEMLQVYKDARRHGSRKRGITKRGKI